MLVEQFNPQTGTTEELIVYTDDYPHAGKMEFPFDNLDQLLEEEALPPIPDFPSIWKTVNTNNEELPKK